MNKLITLFLLISSLMFSQGFTVEYSAFMAETKDGIKRLGKLKSDSAHYILKISKNESFMEYFATDYQIRKTERSINQPFGNREYYVNLNDSISITREFLGSGTYLIPESLAKWKWKITKEKKNILGYTAYKAVSKDNDSHTIVWFTSEVKTNLGPAYYLGLSGLILEFKSVYKNDNDPFIIYGKALNIKKSKDLIIEKPNDGTLISPQEFQKKLYSN